MPSSRDLTLHVLASLTVALAGCGDSGGAGTSTVGATNPTTGGDTSTSEPDPTTTTGGAARILDWLEEWQQTEWPELDATMTSVTEQWTTIAVAGPTSRAVIAKLAPDLDVSNEAFGFMTFRETVLASGIPARVCRISFSGELAFEVNVSGWFGQRVWEDIHAAGEEFGITPYGTETMHVLRAEKGYPIVGQDTDGSVTPQDAGMGWAVSKLKDFIGKRSFTRADTARPDRKHLVSVLPLDRTLRLPEGTQVIAHTTAPGPAGVGQVPMLGHVTSSYDSVALGRTFGLALIRNGRNLIGQTLTAAVDDRFVDVSFADLQHDSVKTVADAYGQLGLEFSDTARAKVQAWADDHQPGHRGTHDYELADFGLTEGQVRDAFADYLAAYDASA